MFPSTLILLSLIAIELTKALLTDQTFLIESSRDIGTTYTLSVNGESETMTLTMSGPDNIWMGAIFGAEDMFNASAYVYYLENNEWIFAERYLNGEQDAGQLIEIIGTNNYTVTNENGTTTLVFTRPWIGSHPTSFTLSNDDTVFQYGFARGTDGILAYHGNEGRSHSFHTLQHLCCDCNTTDIGGCGTDLQCQSIVCTDFDSRCCGLEWREPCDEFAFNVCLQTAPSDIIPTCCGCLTASSRQNRGRGRNNEVIIGCDADTECADIVCSVDSFCCGEPEGVWDDFCVEKARAVCNGEELARCCECTSINVDGGCLADAICENTICDNDAFCCAQGEQGRGSWDNICVEQAIAICNGDGLPILPLIE